MKVNVNEIKSVIAPYGVFKGYPATIIKLAGCNLRCKGCTDCRKSILGINKLMEEINTRHNKVVIFTGGEPLVQETIFEAVYELVGRGYKVLIESNGSIPLEETLYKRGFKYRINLRVPTTEEHSKNNLDILANLLSGDEVNFNIQDIKDYKFAKQIMRKYNTKATYVLTPIPELNDLVEDWAVEDELLNVKVDVQTERMMYYV